MRYDARTVDIPTAGTRVQVLDETARVLWIRFTARQGNTGGVYIGDGNVSSTRGRELRPPETTNAYGSASTTVYEPGSHGGPFRPGSLPISDFWVDADTNGNDVDYEVIYA